MDNQIVIYKSKDGSISLDVNLKDENVWLTQSQMINLFEKDQSVVSRALLHEPLFWQVNATL